MTPTIDAYMTALTGVRDTAPLAAISDMFGARKITPDAAPVLAASLPYRTVYIGGRYSDIPASLTHKFRYSVYASELDRALGEPLLSFQDVLPNLAGRKVTLVYAPATEADARLAASYVPTTHADGSAPTAEEFARARLPAYLIQVRPELRVDGVVRATGAPITMGTSLLATGAFTTLDLSSGWDSTDDSLTAGQITAIGLDLQGIDIDQLRKLDARLNRAKIQIESNDPSGLTGEQVSGDVVTAEVWSYFAGVDEGGRAMRTTARMIDLPALSFGLAHIDIDVASVFGIARSAWASGIVLDIGHMRNIRWSQDNDASAWITYNRIMGVRASALEHQIPGALFIPSGATGETISAVKLLGMAADSGQRIYTITTANAAAALPRLALSPQALEDISAAVAVGKEVVVHERALKVLDWVGEGYIITDPETGAGAYMISGGASGGKLLCYSFGLLAGFMEGLFLFGFMFALFTGPLGFLVALAYFAVIAAFIVSVLVAMDRAMSQVPDDEMYKCWAGGLFGGLDLAAIFMEFLAFKSPSNPPKEMSGSVQAVIALIVWAITRVMPDNAATECMN